MTSTKVGYTVSGWRIYRMASGYRLKCSDCGRDISCSKLFTRGKGSVPICRKCRPFDIIEKEWTG